MRPVWTPGVLLLEVAAHDAGDLVHEAIEMEGQLAEQKGLRLEGTAPDSRVSVRCDRTRIVQVLATCSATR